MKCRALTFYKYLKAEGPKQFSVEPESTTKDHDRIIKIQTKNCIVHRKTNTVHWVSSSIYFDAAPTCSGTYVPSSGSVFVLVSM
jgi:hypothetical protein